MIIRQVAGEDTNIRRLVERAAEEVGGLAVRWTRGSERFRLVPLSREKWRKRRRDGGLVPGAVCWHAHGHFFCALIRMAAERGVRLRIDTVLGRIETMNDLAGLLWQGQPEGEWCDCPHDETLSICAEEEE